MITTITTPLMAIDPGPKKSGYVVLDNQKQLDSSGTVPNDDMRAGIAYFFRRHPAGTLAVEMIASYGMPVGAEVFETCVEIGRFIQIARMQLRPPRTANVCRVTRQAVKLHLCGNTHARDSNIRQALIDLIGPPGTKRLPGPTHGVSGDAWAALGVAATILELRPNLDAPLRPPAAPLGHAQGWVGATIPQGAT